MSRSLHSAAVVAVALVACASPLQGASAAGPGATDRPWPWSVDGIFVQAGRASDTSTFTAGVLWEWPVAWRIGQRAEVRGYNEIAFGQWRSDVGTGGGRALVTQVGLTPTFRLWPGGGERGWFLEGAIGLNVLTPVYRTRDKSFSTAFNFGDHVAVGYRTASRYRTEWSLRVQHYSNAGIDRPNPGEDFVQLRFTVLR